MPTTIKKINEDKILVNNKEIYRTSDNDWVAREELTFLETQILSKWMRATGLVE